MTGFRFLACLFLVLTPLSSLFAEISLIAPRVDIQQVTEVRFDVPYGCVITGLGFRAHQDNMTTMLCRYHRVSSDGKLVEPKEARVGSEPDHACETTVLLPDGYVMVGFGGRGAPEWDITTLRVWARKLRADGTLGKIEVFEDGKDPKMGLEREVHLAESDRALTGAGMRFNFNDIAGIYGSSSRIVSLSRETLKKKIPLRAFIVDKALASSQLIRNAATKYGVNQIYVSEKEVSPDMVILDAAARETGRLQLPEARVDEVAGKMASAALNGKRGAAVWVSAGDKTVFGTLNELNLEAIRLLSVNPFLRPDGVLDSVVRAKFGEASADVQQALRWTSSASDLIFKVCGLQFLAQDGRLRPYVAARASLEKLAKDRMTRQKAEPLLNPTDHTIGLVEADKLAAAWVLANASEAVDAANKKTPKPGTEEIVQGIATLREVAPAWQAAAEAFVNTSLYAIDSAPATRESAEDAVKRLLQSAKDVDLDIGAADYCKSLNTAWTQSEKSSPMAKAFQSVEGLTASGEPAKAAEKLSEMLNDPSLSAHIAKRNWTIGLVATGLDAIWNHENLRVLRGGDGSWMIAKVGGKWAFVNQPNAICFYFDATFGPLEKPADCILTFDYFDEGTEAIHAHYDSEFEVDQHYHPTDMIARTNTKKWKTATMELKNTRLTGTQNNYADFRILGANPLAIRNIKLRMK